jgi:hypothetical protein
MLKIAHIYFVVTALIFALFPSHLFSDETEYDKGDVLKLSPAFLHPTQFLYGRLEVEDKIKELKEIMDSEGEEGVTDFLKAESGEVVIGPKNSKWLVDGHHQARALEILRESDPRFRHIPFYAEVKKEWNELTPKEFEKAMKLGNKKGKEGRPAFVYLQDEKGRLRSFSELPRKLSAMKDFPWRSLVWLLKKEKVIEPTEKIPYQEFFLAEFLRKKIHFPSKLTPKAYERALEAAIELIENTPEEKLSGFKKVSARTCAKILKSIQ